MEDVLAVQQAAEGKEVASTLEERVPSDEWTAAALAHASVLLTLVLAMVGGIGLLVGPAIPLVMYLGYREKSRFVAFHALQALAYQVAGVVFFLVLVVVTVAWVTIAWTMSGLLSAALIGLLLIPFALVLTLLTVLLLVCIPIAWLGYGLVAAYQVYQGRDFRYRLIGEWLEREVRL